MDRPPKGLTLKPVSKSYIEKVKEELLNAGFKVEVEETLTPTKRVTWRNTITALYNYIVRIPLKHSEIVGLYGDLGVEALDNLIAKNLAIKIPWSGNIYYKGVVV